MFIEIRESLPMIIMKRKL